MNYHEWRVVWHRASWSKTTWNKQRVFANLRLAERFADRLQEGTELDILRIDHRATTRWIPEPRWKDVGRWTECL